MTLEEESDRIYDKAIELVRPIGLQIAPLGDGAHRISVILALFTVAALLGRQAGYSDDDVRELLGIAFDVADAGLASDVGASGGGGS